MNGWPAKRIRLTAAGGLVFLALSGCCQPGGLATRRLARWPDGPECPQTPDGQRVCPVCGRPICATPAAGAEAKACPACPDGYYNHPRFHPVPTQPVFGPRCDPPLAAQNQPGSPGGNAIRARASGPSSPQRSSPGSGPELVPPPSPALPSTKGKDSSADQLSLVSPNASSWLFSPVAPPTAKRLDDPRIEPISDASASDERILR